MYMEASVACLNCFSCAGGTLEEDSIFRQEEEAGHLGTLNAVMLCFAGGAGGALAGAQRLAGQVGASS